MNRLMTGIVGVLVVGMFTTGCKEEELTYSEAQQALEETVASTKSEVVATEIITLTTSFTIGQAVEDAAEELRSFVASQVPCSTVTLENATVTIDFGTLDDACTFNGHTYAGVASVHIERNDMGDVVVSHEWADLTNGDVTLDGGATVTWSFDDGTRHVAHDAVWSDGKRSVHATGDRTQRLIDPELGLAGGIQIDGARTWDASGKVWDLQIEGVQMRGQDPVPQAGQYTLTTPEDKEMGILFERIDEDTIRVTFTGLKKEHVFEVNSTGK